MPQIDWRDSVDIVLIAGLLYQSYKFFVGSRAGNVLRGLLLLLILYGLAFYFDLRATRWIFERTAPFGLFALLVIFQPELRAALERFGQSGNQPSISGNPVQEIISAVHELASHKKGALIAIQVRHDLSEYGTAGSIIGSPISSALLLTIFDSKGPLHDGGVILQGDVISHAGAIFPLSDRDRGNGLSVKHGTRHRAGLGLAEHTDALVIIVSEERGTVSLAQAGVLRSDIAPSEVVKALREVYGT